MARGQAEQARLAALAESAWVAEIVGNGLGDPRLTAWEEAFLQGLKRRALSASGQPDADHRRLSAKQVAILLEIAAKLDQPPPDDDAAAQEAC